MNDHSFTDAVRPLLRVRQIRDFADVPVEPGQLVAIADAARWSGSAQNKQPWRFIAVSDTSIVRAIGEAGQPNTQALMSAAAAIAIVIPDSPDRAVSLAYDEGRAAERILIAATLLGLGGGIGWIRDEVRPRIAEILGLPPDRTIRTIVAIGHPSDAARALKSALGEARLPRDEVVFEDRWRG